MYATEIGTTRVFDVNDNDKEYRVQRHEDVTVDGSIITWEVCSLNSEDWYTPIPEDTEIYNRTVAQVKLSYNLK